MKKHMNFFVYEDNYGNFYGTNYKITQKGFKRLKMCTYKGENTKSWEKFQEYVDACGWELNHWFFVTEQFASYISCFKVEDASIKVLNGRVFYKNSLGYFQFEKTINQKGFHFGKRGRLIYEIDGDDYYCFDNGHLMPIKEYNEYKKAIICEQYA